MSDNVEKTHPVEGDIAQFKADLTEREEWEEDFEGAPLYEETLCENNDNVCKKNSIFRKFFSRDGFPRLLILLRYLFPLLTGVVLLCLSFGELFEFYQSVTVGTISLFGLYKATFATAFRAFGAVTDSTFIWYAVLQLIGALIGALAFLAAAVLSALATVTAYRTFANRPNSAIGNRMKVIFKFAFPNRICLFLSNAAYLLFVAFPYYFSFVLERFYYMGIEPEPPIYVKSHPTFWVVVVLTAITLALAIASARFERQKRMNMFVVEYDEENEQ